MSFRLGLKPLHNIQPTEDLLWALGLSKNAHFVGNVQLPILEGTDV